MLKLAYDKNPRIAKIAARRCMLNFISDEAVSERFIRLILDPEIHETAASDIMKTFDAYKKSKSERTSDQNNSTN